MYLFNGKHKKKDDLMNCKKTHWPTRLMQYKVDESQPWGTGL